MFGYFPCGDATLIVKAGRDISPATNQLVRKLLYCLDERPLPGVSEVIPSYNELLVCYDPLQTDCQQLKNQIQLIEPDLDMVELPLPARVVIYVCYGGELGPDLSEVARYNGLREEEVVDLHTSVDYPVYMLGFTPGFCYLGGMDKRLSTPRKTTPRIKIPAGSVGIAEAQTGIYPIESPGGWQLIGRTPAELFNPKRENVFLVNPGDIIRFKSITLDVFFEMKRQVQSQL